MRLRCAPRLRLLWSSPSSSPAAAARKRAKAGLRPRKRWLCSATSIGRCSGGCRSGPITWRAMADARPAVEGGLVDQHACADRVPAGDPRRGRLPDQQVRQRQSGAAEGQQGALGTERPPQRQRGNRTTSPRPSTARQGLRRLPRRRPRRRRREDRQGGLARKLDAHLESSPLAVDGTLYIGTDTTKVLALDASDGKTLAVQRPRRDQSQPQLSRGQDLRRRLPERMFALNAKSGKPSGAPTRARSRRTAEAASSPRPRSPSATSTRPATTAPSSPSTRGPARSPGPSRPAPRSTARPPWPRCPAPRRPSTSAPKTAASSPSTRHRQGALAQTSAARSPARPRSSATPSTPRASRPATIGFDVLTHKRTFALNQAGYTPMVSDGKRLYLVGYYDVIGLEPSRR